MLICESILMAIIAMLGVYVTYTDIKNGIIQNKALAIAIIPGIIVNAVYFAVYSRDFLGLYVSNLIIISMLAIALYGFHFWAAGDSKLLICVTALFPARLFDNNAFSVAPGLNAVIIIFLISYIFIVGDSVWQWIKKEKFYAGKLTGLKGVQRFLISYMISFLYLRGLSELLRHCLGEIYYSNQLIFCFINIFVAIIIHSNKLFRKWYMLLLAAVPNILFWKEFSVNQISLYSYGILLLALLLRYLLNGYNYKEIPTENAEKGMVLAYPTIVMFMPSRIKGLPETTSEDMRSRLTKEQAEAVRRWKDSKYGKSSILIVRKIPFAIFIVVGELLYFFIRIWR